MKDKTLFLLYASKFPEVQLLTQGKERNGGSLRAVIDAGEGCHSASDLRQDQEQPGAKDGAYMLTIVVEGPKCGRSSSVRTIEDEGAI